MASWPLKGCGGGERGWTPKFPPHVRPWHRTTNAIVRSRAPTQNTSSGCTSFRETVLSHDCAVDVYKRVTTKRSPCIDSDILKLKINKNEFNFTCLARVPLLCVIRLKIGCQRTAQGPVRNRSRLISVFVFNNIHAHHSDVTNCSQIELITANISEPRNILYYPGFIPNRKNGQVHVPRYKQVRKYPCDTPPSPATESTTSGTRFFCHNSKRIGFQIPNTYVIYFMRSR